MLPRLPTGPTGSAPAEQAASTPAGRPRDPAAPAPTSGDSEWDLPTGSAAPTDETIATRIECLGETGPLVAAALEH
ncbi:hypothetical protein SSPO_010000 [Streptomyces antimycoticus]|uniref:Uncharacterized protein n=1 Tax=Streptomyces antimycoticus TaxID=68175 RepID=A0A499UDI0_9ACTN|nr:hypothetical protein SSPO_010000 [Streptomyces antimycoticus]